MIDQLGSTGVAALALDRQFLGTDINETARRITRGRLLPPLV
jgi:hypothetical protein